MLTTDAFKTISKCETQKTSKATDNFAANKVESKISKTTSKNFSKISWI